MTEPERAGGAPAVTRSIRILDLLAERRGQTVTLTEIARTLGLAKSSVSNLCLALEEGGLVRRTAAGYLLGRRTVELGSAYLSGFDQIREFYRICEESDVLRRQLVQIAMLDGARVLYLAVHEGRERFPLSASVGDRYPASATAVGTVLLSELSPERVAALYWDPQEFVGFTERSTSTIAQLAGQTGRHPGAGLRPGRGRGALLRARGGRAGARQRVREPVLRARRLDRAPHRGGPGAGECAGRPAGRGGDAHPATIADRLTEPAGRAGTQGATVNPPAARIRSGCPKTRTYRV